uniref:asparagine synthase (glutamine-hydrolyzing) n=1 Tax=Desulfobacca sp. TaxID=2067990 RepID=UPI00404B2C15
MCGICGIIKTAAPVSEAEIRAMRAVLVHRGPDSRGLWTAGTAGLGHRRLSIIDLSEAASQPLLNENGRIVLVFNGEIYNFQPLRHLLQTKGHVFRSRADSEVIIHAYEEFGVDCLQRLRGMFAFALWDQDRQRLFAARDRLGKKPLFYCQQGDAISFASEIKAILALTTTPREIAWDHLGFYLSLNYTPAPATLFRGIRQLEPGEYLLWEKGRLTINEYWDLAMPPTVAMVPNSQVLQEFTDVWQEAVRLRLISDVPVGAFLSGGLDSAAVVSTAAALYPGRLKTFSIGFGERSYDERGYARQVARRWQTEHHEILVTPRVEDILPRLVWHAEEPTADSSMVPVYYLAQFAAREVKVVLTGDGADEVLAGYPTYQAHYLLRWLQAWPTPVQAALSRLAQALPVSHRKVSLDFKLKRLTAALAWNVDYAHYSWRRIWAPAELAQLLPGLPVTEAYQQYQRWLDRAGQASALNRMLYADTRFYLPNDMLVKVDRMTMAHGLEARAPFLDHVLVELAARLPEAWKLRGLVWKKYLLRRLLRDQVPATIRWQSKRGFNVPVGLWFKGELRDFCHAHLQQLRHLGCFAMDYVETVWQQHQRDERDWSHHLWGLLILSLWWQTFFGPQKLLLKGTKA